MTLKQAAEFYNQQTEKIQRIKENVRIIDAVLRFEHESVTLVQIRKDILAETMVDLVDYIHYLEATINEHVDITK